VAVCAWGWTGCEGGAARVGSASAQVTRE